MCDIKTVPEDSICHGCLSRDRKLSPLAMYDLYWSLLTEDQKIESLAIPYIAMCWECTATLRRTQKFQLQVQKAHTILQDCLELSPTKETLSPLSIQHKEGYDAIFQRNTLVIQPITEVKIPIINVTPCEAPYKKKFEDIQDVSDILNIDKAATDNVKASSYNVTIEQKHSDDTDDECKFQKSSDNSDNDDLETDNFLCSSADQNLPGPSKPRRSSRQGVLKSSQIVDKPSPKDRKLKTDVVRLPIQFVSPSETDILLRKLDKTDVEEIEAVEDKTKSVPLVKTPAIAQLELELKNLIKTQNSSTVKNYSQKHGAQKNKSDEKTNKDNDLFELEFSSEDDFTDTDFDDDDFEDDFAFASQLNEKIKTKPAPLVKDPAIVKLEFELKNLIVVKNDLAEASGEGNPTKRKRERKDRPESDPDFSPDEKDEPKEKTTDVDGESKHSLKKKYKRVCSRYNNIEDVLPYFSQTEMSEQEFRSILHKEDAIVNDKKPQKCFECGTSFQHTRTLVHHARYVHKITNYKTVKNPTIKLPPPPQKPRLWRCALCRRPLRAQHALAHMNEHHRRQYFCAEDGCEWCPKIFWEKEDVLAHWEAIHRECVCGECGRRCRRRSAMDWHMREVHVQARTLPCGSCGRLFATRRERAQHARAHAPPGPPELRYCVECDVTYRSEHAYNKHVHAKHMPRKRWPCEKCGKVLVNKPALERHVALQHNGVTGYQCEICGKYLSKKFSLEIHIKRHKNLIEKPPNNKLCTVCGRKFQQNRTLRHHMYTHTGERPYKCAHCAAAYTQPHCLKVHLAKAHGIQTTVPENLPPADDLIDFGKIME